METSTKLIPSESSEIAFGCPICMEDYSPSRYPIVAPACGHSICVDCGNERKSNVCVTCKSNSYGMRHLRYDEQWAVHSYTEEQLCSNLWKKNFALLDVIDQSNREKQKLEEKLTELREKFEEIAPNDIDFTVCFHCETKERLERMRICESCAEEWKKEWKEMKEEEILPFIICGCCCVEEHPGHSIAKYLPWKLKDLFTSTVSDGKSTVFSMDEVCAHEIEKGKEQLGKWNEKIDSFGSIECKTYRGGLSIVDSLKNESDRVCRASEDTLPTLRMYTKVVKDSISRLDLLKRGEEKENPGTHC